MNRDEVPEVRSKVRRATAPSALTCAVNSCECGLRAETSSSHASARLSSSRRCSSGRSDSMETALSSLTSSTGSAGVISAAGAGGWSLSSIRASSAGGAVGSGGSDVDERAEALVGETGAQELGVDLEGVGDPGDHVVLDALQTFTEHGELVIDAGEIVQRLLAGAALEGREEADRVLGGIDQLRQVAGGHPVEHRQLARVGAQRLDRL